MDRNSERRSIAKELKGDAEAHALHWHMEGVYPSRILKQIVAMLASVNSAPLVAAASATTRIRLEPTYDRTAEPLSVLHVLDASGRKRAQREFWKACSVLSVSTPARSMTGRLSGCTAKALF